MSANTEIVLRSEKFIDRNLHEKWQQIGSSQFKTKDSQRKLFIATCTCFKVIKVITSAYLFFLRFFYASTIENAEKSNKRQTTKNSLFHSRFRHVHCWNLVLWTNMCAWNLFLAWNSCILPLLVFFCTYFFWKNAYHRIVNSKRQLLINFWVVCLRLSFLFQTTLQTTFALLLKTNIYQLTQQ